MFGLESHKKQPEEFLFDLEKEIKDPNKRKEILERIEKRLQRIKEILRTGESQEEFDRFGSILHGYTSLIKIIGRVKIK